MNVDCPYCHASSVCETSDNTAQQLVEPLLNPAALEHAISNLSKLITVHPLIKVILSMTLIVAVQYLKSNRRSLSLTQKSYRCEGCNKVFTVFYPFV